MKILGRLLLVFAVATTVTYALPPLQHPLKGLVHAVDVEKHVLTIEPVGKDSPTEFQIQDGRTRLRRDGKPAALADLAVGQIVHLYYRQEVGRYVATEVTWKSGAPASKDKS